MGVSLSDRLVKLQTWGANLPGFFPFTPFLYMWMTSWNTVQKILVILTKPDWKINMWERWVARDTDGRGILQGGRWCSSARRVWQSKWHCCGRNAGVRSSRLILRLGDTTILEGVLKHRKRRGWKLRLARVHYARECLQGGRWQSSARRVWQSRWHCCGRKAAVKSCH